MTIKNIIIAATLCTSFLCFAGPEQAAMNVWVSEAVVATYSYDYKDFLLQQQHIAKYFTADGWINYSKALKDSKLPEAVAKNHYEVSAIPIDTPQVHQVDPNHWNASIKLLVIYKNATYKQHQMLNVDVNITTAPSGQGIRGLSVSNLKSTLIKEPCQCAIEEEHVATPSTKTEKK